MKRLIGSLIMMAMLLILAACGDSNAMYTNRGDAMSHLQSSIKLFEVTARHIYESDRPLKGEDKEEYDEYIKMMHMHKNYLSQALKSEEFTDTERKLLKEYVGVLNKHEKMFKSLIKTKDEEKVDAIFDQYEDSVQQLMEQVAYTFF